MGPCLSCPYPQRRVVEPVETPHEKAVGDMINRAHVQGFLLCQRKALKTIEDNLDKLTAGEIIEAIRELVPEAK